MEEDVPRDESEVRKHFGQSFLRNVTESRAFWEGDDDTGVLPTASLEEKKNIKMKKKHYSMHKLKP